MKKLVAIVLALCFLLAACGGPTDAAQNEVSNSGTIEEENAETDTPSQSSSKDEIAQEIDDADAQSADSAISTFGVPLQDFIDVMNIYLSDDDTFNAFDQEVEITTTDDGSIAYGYAITDGSTIILYEDPNTKELTQVFVFTESDKITDTADAELVGTYLAIVTACFSTDQDDLDALDAALQIVETGFSGEAMNFYNNSLASFSYIVSDGISMLSVTPPM